MFRKVNVQLTPQRECALFSFLCICCGEATKPTPKCRLAGRRPTMERQRSIVLIGVPENNKATAKNKFDWQTVEKLFDRLGVETEPVVYRLGKIPTPSGVPRLLKCVLPASNFQRLLCDNGLQHSSVMKSLFQLFS